MKNVVPNLCEKVCLSPLLTKTISRSVPLKKSHPADCREENLVSKSASKKSHLKNSREKNLIEISLEKKMLKILQFSFVVSPLTSVPFKVMVNML